MEKMLLSLVLLGVVASPQSPSMVTPGAVISQPDLQQPLGKEWSVAKGTWTATDGVLIVHALPEQHHIPVLHLATGPVDLIWECEFQVGSKQSFLVGCDGLKHVGRVIITPTSIAIAESSPDPATGKPGNHILSKQVVDLKPGQWQHLRVEYAGDEIAARLNDIALQGQHPYLATPKKQWWFAASEGVQIRNIRVTAANAKPVPK